MIKKVWKIVREVESELRINLPIDFVEIEDTPFHRESGYFIVNEEGEAIIAIGSNLDGKLLRSTVLHEIGHALEEVRGSKQFMKPFFRDSDSKRANGIRYEIATRTFFLWKNMKPPLGFVSKYATLNPSEDFAETYAAVMMKCKFPKSDNKLQRKVKAIKDLIAYFKNGGCRMG